MESDFIYNNYDSTPTYLWFLWLIWIVWIAVITFFVIRAKIGKNQKITILSLISIASIFTILPFVLPFITKVIGILNIDTDSYLDYYNFWWFFFWFVGENFVNFINISHQVLWICILIFFAILTFKLKFAKYLKVIFSTLILGALSFSIFFFISTRDSYSVLSKCQDFLIMNRHIPRTGKMTYIPRTGKMTEVGYFEDGGVSNSSPGLFIDEIRKINHQKIFEKNPKHKGLPYSIGEVSFLIASVPVSPQEIAKVKECLLPKYDSRFFGLLVW